MRSGALPEQLRLKRNRAFATVVAFLVFALDQASKWVVTYPLQLQFRREIQLFDFFDLRWVENKGVSLGLLTADSELGRWLLVAMTAGIAIFVTAWLWREKRRDDSFALALVLGGALGNIVDRVRYGYVVDFADLHFGEWRPFLVFNVGDAAITVGVLLLLVRALLMRDGRAKKKES
ncbi:MAG: signal peptidase II [Alphaproteobacteria bacterium]|nr:MAG: signal peptidase II [Alphaproteobacteria bacterium]